MKHKERWQIYIKVEVKARNSYKNSKQTIR